MLAPLAAVNPIRAVVAVLNYTQLDREGMLQKLGGLHNASYNLLASLRAATATTALLVSQRAALCSTFAAQQQVGALAGCWLPLVGWHPPPGWRDSFFSLLKADFGRAACCPAGQESGAAVSPEMAAAAEPLSALAHDHASASLAASSGCGARVLAAVQAVPALAQALEGGAAEGKAPR